MTRIDRKTIIISVVVISVLAAVLLIFLNRNKNQTHAIPFAFVGFRNFEVNVFALGELDSEKSITVSSGLKEEGKIVFLIEDGTSVDLGDVLVKMDPAPFEEKVLQLTSKVNEWNAIVAAQQQTLEWEKIQADQELQTSKYDFQVAELELQRLEKGDGPLELSRLEGAMLEEKKKYEELKGYIADLEDLVKKGYSNPLEIAQAKERVDKLKKSYEVARQQYESYRDFILPTLLKSAKVKVEKTKMVIEQTRKGAGFKIGKAIAELNKSKQEYKTLRQLLADAQKELEKTTVRAPQRGLVVLKESYREGEMRKPRVGDMVIRNQPILFLPDISSMMAKILIREVDLYKIDIGKPVKIQVDAYPELSFEGEVVFIGILAERRREVRGGEKYFKVNVTIHEPDSKLRPGMTARVKILSKAKKEKTIAVPIHAVFQEEERRFCYIARPEGFEIREVLLGAQNDTFVQILDGLKKGEKICLSRPPKKRVTTTKYLEKPQKMN